ncbi:MULTISPECIES: DUF6901 family protein [unclassified Lentimonas]|uniref:DUF6901 family protein n=2 Tax=unclassified Lentimonas TaxID=2630993 RepID=UPI0013895D8E|nr:MULTISPECIES: hypothetical protein [unclassified Lentimonas]
MTIEGVYALFGASFLMQSENTFWFNYQFKFPDETEVTFEVRMDAETGASVQPHPVDLPEWTLLSKNKCSHCPLNTSEHQHCPAAVSILDVVQYFHTVSSIQPVEVCVTSPDRQTTKQGVGLPAAIAALMGARFAGSGCPVTAKFKPMVRHHLPFSSSEEATYRIVAMHALAQFLRMREGLEPDWELTELSKMCQDVNTLNLDFCRRLRSLEVNDSTMNALTGLDSLLQMVDITLDEQLLEDMKKLFRAHLEG